MRSSNRVGWSKVIVVVVGTNLYNCRNLPIKANLKIGGFRINPGVITGSPDLAVCAPSEELLPGHEAETGDAVLGPALAALHAALPAAALYAPDTDLATNI